MTDAPELVKMKICMAGEAMVGKSSLIRRYVLDEYDERYTATLGTKITKRTMTVAHPKEGRRVAVNLIIWDIMGAPSLRDLLKEAYYHGAHGVLGVVDLTREETLRELDAWSRSIRTVAGSVPTYVVVNKADLEAQARIGRDTVEAFCRERGYPWSYASAKTGAGVEEAFEGLVRQVLSA
jgi:small GTP-binding protein